MKTLIEGLTDGFCKVTFDGRTFASVYTKVEGIDSGDFAAAIRKEQTMWPERIDENAAEDTGGKRDHLIGDEWVRRLLPGRRKPLKAIGKSSERPRKRGSTSGVYPDFVIPGVI